MLGRLKQIVIKELIQALRNKRLRFFIIMPPLLQLMMFGYVANLDVKNIATALYDLDNSSESRELARRLTASGYFTVSHRPSTPAGIRELLDENKILCAVQINRGFGKNIQRGVPAAVQLIVDGTDSNTGIIALNYANSVVMRYSRDIAREHAIRVQEMDVRTRVWYNPDLKSRNFFLPGVIGSIIMLSCIMLTSMSVVREREIGTMEQLMVTPITPFEMILGKTVPFALIAFAQMVLVTTVGVFWFSIPMKGSLVLLFACTSVYLLSTLGIGLLISTVSQTQQQALMASNLFFMPAIMLSGFTFPIENMPVLFQYLAYANPLKYFLVIIRGIFLKGDGIGHLWPQVAGLFALGSIILAISAVRFRKRLK